MEALTLESFKKLSEHMEQCRLKAIIDELEKQNKLLICTQETFDKVFPGFVKSDNIKIVHRNMLPSDALYLFDNKPDLFVSKPLFE